MKKTFKWLDENNINYVFHDYKKEGIDDLVTKQAIADHGWDIVINRRGTTWRNLTDDIKNSMNDAIALKIAQENPSIVKRPLLAVKNKTYLGFKPEDYNRIFLM